MKRETRIKVTRPEHQFAAAHFLVEMGKCERLHGHNYAVTVEIGGEPGADHTLVDFNTLNPMISEVCASLDHKVLIAKNDKRMSLDIGAGEVEVRFGEKRYVIPREDCVMLDVESTTVEKLAAYVCDRLAGELENFENLKWIETGVSEGHAQMATSRRSMTKE